MFGVLYLSNPEPRGFPRFPSSGNSLSILQPLSSKATPPQEFSLKVQKTARYYTVGELGEQTRYLWLCCHGYGQLGQHFARRFDAIADEAHLVVAPEGLNRFYWQEGKERRPAATWMTSHARQDEIADYTAYLEQVIINIRRTAPQPLQLILFGFSQGTQTIWRYLYDRCPDLAAIIMYAGTIPDDLDYSTHTDYLAPIPKLFAVGDQDEFLTPRNLSRYETFLDQLPSELGFQRLDFSGEHRIYRSVLRDIKQRVLKTIE